MKEEIAFELMKLLKKDGHAVLMADQPNANRHNTYVVGEKHELAAIVGAKGMTPEGVMACCDRIRRVLHRHLAPYTIETEGNKSRFFKDAAFAAW